MTAGTARDTEVDEVFVVRRPAAARSRFEDGEVIPLAPGVAARLRAGERTTWTVEEPLRKVWVAARGPDGRSRNGHDHRIGPSLWLPSACSDWLGCMNMSEPLVVMKDVNKHFGDLHVLKDINLTVGTGEVVVLIGPSGSGKSTLCRTINRLETFESGSITIDGKELPEEGKELAALRADVGMVFQSFNLFAHKTILENVTLGPIKVRKMTRRPTPRSARASSSSGSASTTRPRSTPPSSPAASSSASPSPARSRWTPRSCSSTSRPRRSTPR